MPFHIIGAECIYKIINSMELHHFFTPKLIFRIFIRLCCSFKLLYFILLIYISFGLYFSVKKNRFFEILDIIFSYFSCFFIQG
jgi:hypothetical protein